MDAMRTHTGSVRGRLAALGAFACLLAGGFAISYGGEDAGAARAKEIGKTKSWPKASCPTPNSNSFPARRGCQVLGEVTGFQIEASGKEDLMRVPADGHIVGWSVDLARPNKSERNFFERVLGDRAFNGAPSARLSMLSKADGRKYRLRGQSPVIRMNPLLGRRQYFTLNNPIEVKQGWTAALTTQTWVPSFAHDLRNDDLWRASRPSDRCEGEKNLTERSRPHLKPGTVKTYGCTYRDARILYWAYFKKAE
jgi:hypothetical protein